MQISEHFRTSALVPSHVIVVGGGLAGLSAALEALAHGARVTLLDKAKSLGGNSAKATSGMSAVATVAQYEQKIEDSVPLFERDTLASGKDPKSDFGSDPSLVHVLGLLSADAHAWLTAKGLNLSDITQLGGHSAPRAHRCPETPDGKPVPVGWTIVSVLLKHLSEQPLDRLTVLLNATVERLLVANNGQKEQDVKIGLAASDKPVPEVTGVLYRNAVGNQVTLFGDAVILTSGGYACDHSPTSLLREFAPGVAHLPSTNGPFATGDGVKLGREIGAALVGMDRVQVHPTGFIDPNDVTNPTKFLAPEAVRGCGGILLNHEGKRFVNELGLRDHVSQEIFANCKPVPLTTKEVRPSPTRAFLVLNEEAASKFGKVSLGFYKSKGFFRTYGNAGEFAAAEGLPVEHVTAELLAYSQAAAQGRDGFGKTVFPVKSFRPDQTLHVAWITPSVHYTMGGLKIDTSAQVIFDDDARPWARHPIQGLFAAGEVSGGVHGKNRLGGNSLLECVVFGRVAGRRAAMTCLDAVKPLDAHDFRPLVFREKYTLVGNAKLFRFELPSPKQKLGYSSCQYIAVRASLGGKEQVRYYSPVSRYDAPGHIDLVLKVDDQKKGDALSMAHYIDRLEYGQTLEFKGPVGALNLQLAMHQPGQWVEQKHAHVRRIGLIAGGVGITPMLQILRSLAHHKRYDIPVKLIYAAEVLEDLLYKDDLERLTKKLPLFEVTFVLNKPPEGWKGETGFVNKRIIQEYMFPQSDDLKIVICGPLPMCKALKKLLLEDCAYSQDSFYSFV